MDADGGDGDGDDGGGDEAKADETAADTVVVSQLQSQQNNAPIEQHRLSMVLQPMTVSAIAMAYQKMSYTVYSHNPCSTPTLDELMGHVGGGREDQRCSHRRTLFARLVAVQIKITEYDNPKRYLTKDHYRNALREESLTLGRLKRSEAPKRRCSRGGGKTMGLFEDDMDYLF